MVELYRKNDDQSDNLELSLTEGDLITKEVVRKAPNNMKNERDHLGQTYYPTTYICL